MPEAIRNMDDVRNRNKLASYVHTLRGVYRIIIVKFRPRRSDRQNRYYWPCFVEPFAAYLKDQDNQLQDAEQVAHEILKRRFLTREYENHKNGEVVEYVGSSAALDTKEFNDYLDQCAQFLLEWCGIEVPEPNVYHEPLKLAA